MENNRELDIARFIVEKTDSNLFLTGKAGTGKTTFLRDVKKYTKKKHVVLAPTGVAAVNAGAMTIHSFFQFGFGPYVKGVSEPEGSFLMKKEKKELIRNLELIIIDEISMVRADLLDHINDELQRIRQNDAPFGGVQLLMIGDLQQLPPVAKDDDAEILNAHYQSVYFFDSKALRDSDYYCIELMQVYRQTDQHFIDILNRARTGSVTRADISELNSHYNASFCPFSGDNYIELVTHNNMADSINRQKIDEIESSVYFFDASVTGTFPQDSYPTDLKLQLKKGAQVMFIKNDPDKRFVNGTLGVVESVSENSIEVKLSEGDQSIDVEPMSWENIRYHLDEETHNIEEKKIGSFQQYPLKLAWAITIHKSQGLSFDKAVIDARASFSPGQAYVALSRCRSLDGMVLRSRLTQSVFITDSVVDDYMRGAVQDIESLASTVHYEHFEYERVADSSVSDRDGEETIIRNPHIFDALKEWRLAVSHEKSVPAFTVMYDRTLIELANRLPESISELGDIYGIGPSKIEKYGQAILEVIQTNRGTEDMSVLTPDPVEVHPRNHSPQPARPDKVPSWEISYKMFMEGKSVRQIAQERSLVEGTISGHLARYIESGELDIHRLVPNDDIINKLAEYKRRNPDVMSSKEIFNYFNGTISYGDIKLVLAYLKCTN